MRETLGVLLVAVGIGWVLLTRDKLGLIIAFAGVTMLAYGVLRPLKSRQDDGSEPRIF
jgi:threonine/homoserine/homoserine lactone efflux protein